ncbi:unnamed protein product [Discula destructiva]
MAWLLKAIMDKEIFASPSEPALHEDSRVVIVAGSETTATTFACIFYYVSKYPAVQQKSQSHLGAAYGKEALWSYEKAKTVTFMDDIIHETLRFKPALLTGGYRFTPAEGITIDGTFIPGDTNIFIPVQPMDPDRPEILAGGAQIQFPRGLGRKE